MGYTSLLVLALLFSVTNGETTTTVSASLQSEGESSESNVKETIATSDDSTPLKTSESTIRYSVLNPGDEKSKSDNPENDLSSDSSEEGGAELLLIESLIGADASKFIEDTLNGTEENKAGDDSGFKITVESSDDPIIASNSDGVEVKRDGEFNSDFSLTNKPETILDVTPGSFSNPNAVPSPREPINDRSFRRNSNSESSPLLQLTQGGYQRPFQAADRFSDRQQRLRSESATQQAEAVQTPNRNVNNNPREGNSRPQLPHPIFQSPFSPRPEPVFRYPFAYQANNVANEQHQNYEQSPIFNPQETGFPGFNQGQGNQVSMFQASPRPMLQSPHYLFQTPFQYPEPQQIPLNPAFMSPYLQPNGNPGRFPNYESAALPDGTDFTGLYGNMGPVSPQFQENSHLGSSPNLRGNFYNRPELTYAPNLPRPDMGSQLPPRIQNYPAGRMPIRITPRQRQPSPGNENAKPNENIDMPMNKEDSTNVPFGTRIQRQNGGPPRDDYERRDEVYLRYPMTEAGYATEENLPLQNATEKIDKVNDTPRRSQFPFFTTPRRFNFFSGPDPYKIALENVQRGFPSENNRKNISKNGTNESPSEQSVQNLPHNQLGSDSPVQIFRTYPERNPDLSIPNIPFYEVQGVNSEQDPFAQPPVFRDGSFQFSIRSKSPKEEQPNKIPECAKNSNSSFCFEDPDYPRGDVLYALNSDSLTDRFLTPDRQFEDFPLVDALESPDKGDSYICESEIKYGHPLRAQNVQGSWKIVVNMERAIGRGNFIQPVRLEICRGAGQPCNFTQVKTSCVQKYSLQRLLSWSAERGVHSDVFKIPVACSCQVVENKP